MIILRAPASELTPLDIVAAVVGALELVCFVYIVARGIAWWLAQQRDGR